MENELKIGVDIDEVLVEFFKKYLELFNPKFGKSIKLHEMNRFNIWDITDVSKEDALRLVEDFYDSNSFEQMDLVEGAKESLANLKNIGKIFFITSRPERMKEKTNIFLKKLFGESDFDLYFSGGVWNNSKTKGELCKELGIDIFIEDNPDFALDCAQRGIKTFLLDKPWNKDYQKHNNLFKVKNWGEILERLK